MNITLAKHYGLCEGVKNALKIVEQTKNKYPNEDIYLLNKLVHNQAIIDDIKTLGVKTLDDSSSLEEKINSINKGVIIFSAHGHDSKLDDLARSKGLIVVDSACPRVKANMKSILKAINNHRQVVYIGIENHPETIASLAVNQNIIFIDFKKPNYDLLKGKNHLSIHNQTTLIQDELEIINQNIKRICSDVEVINDICFATSQRQKCLEEVTDQDLIIIIGDKISSNSTRLYEVAKKKFPQCGVYQISNITDLYNIDLSKYKKGFITAGASTPDLVINPIIDYLKNY